MYGELRITDRSLSFREKDALSRNFVQLSMMMIVSCLSGPASVGVSAISGWSCGLVLYEVFIDKSSYLMRFQWVRKLREVFGVRRRSKGWWGHLFKLQ